MKRNLIIQTAKEEMPPELNSFARLYGWFHYLSCRIPKRSVMKMWQTRLKSGSSFPFKEYPFKRWWWRSLQTKPPNFDLKENLEVLFKNFAMESNLPKRIIKLLWISCLFISSNLTLKGILFYGIRMVFCFLLQCQANYL